MTVEERNEIVMKHIMLIKYFARRRCSRRVNEDFDSLINDGVIGMIRAIEKYDPEKGKLGTYASYHIRSHIKRKSSEYETVSIYSPTRCADYKEMEVPMSSYGYPVSVGGLLIPSMTPTHDRVIDSIADKSVGPEDSLILNEDISRALNAVIELDLDVRERDIIFCIKHGLRVSDLSERHGVTRQRIFQIRDRLLEKLRRQLLDPTP
jgi:RNA polymerase sigma factor FliA